VLYRSGYFLAPFVETGYTFLSKGSAHVSAGEPGGPGVIDNRLHAWHVGAGVALDIWRLRFSAGAAGYFVGLSTRFAGVSSSTRDFSLGSILGASANLLGTRHFHFSADFVAHDVPQANLQYFTFGFSIHDDVLSW
jgi:hypothetical protein